MSDMPKDKNEQIAKKIIEAMNNAHIRSTISILKDRSGVDLVEMLTEIWEYMDNRQDVSDDIGNEENRLIGPINSFLFSLKKALDYKNVDVYAAIKDEGKDA